MVGEDHGISNLLKEKDAEIADLRARLDDKDHMLTALRSAARSRNAADRSADPNPAAVRSSTLLDNAPVSPVLAGSPMMSLLSPKVRKRTKSVDEMSRMLDEMIQDRVESGHGYLIKGNRGSSRVASERWRELIVAPVPGMEPLKSSRVKDAPIATTEI
jgi:centromeric protein E